MMKIKLYNSSILFCITHLVASLTGYAKSTAEKVHLACVPDNPIIDHVKGATILSTRLLPNSS